MTNLKYVEIEMDKIRAYTHIVGYKCQKHLNLEKAETIKHMKEIALELLPDQADFRTKAIYIMALTNLKLLNYDRQSLWLAILELLTELSQTTGSWDDLFILEDMLETCIPVWISAFQMWGKTTFLIFIRAWTEFRSSFEAKVKKAGDDLLLEILDKYKAPPTMVAMVK